MKRKNANYNKTAVDGQSNNQNETTQSVVAEYSDGTEVHVRHYVVKNGLCHIYFSDTEDGVSRTISVSNIRHIIRGGAE